MRLSERQVEIIRKTAQEIFGAGVTVHLFGSRVDDSARGGDIDLLVESEQPVPDAFRKGLQMVARLQDRLGDQRIDVLVLDPDTQRMPIHEEALRTGVPL